MGKKEKKKMGKRIIEGEQDRKNRKGIGKTGG
jgi:hypothetical protein